MHIKTREFWVKEKLFIAIFLVFGCLFLFLTPPFKVVDESAHLYRAYQVSQFDMVPSNIGQESGGTVPKSLGKLVDLSVQWSKAPRYGRHYFSSGFGLRLEKQKTEVQNFTNTASYPAVDYLPQAVGLRVGQLLGGRVMVMLYAGRLCNLIFLALCLYGAVRLIPWGKRALMAIGLLPMVVYLGASLSPDAFVIGVTALYVAYLIKLYGKTGISTKQWLVMAALVVALVLAKQTYVGLLLSLPILLFRKGAHWKRDGARLGAIGVAVIIVLLGWALIVKGIHTQPIALQRGTGAYAQPSLQEKYILHHPFGFVRAASNTLFSGQSDYRIVHSFFGVLGVLDMPLPLWLVLFTAILLLLSFGTEAEYESHITSAKATGLVVAAAVANVGLILGALYVIWTPPAANYIFGLQGRYFIPTLIALVPVLVGRYKHNIKPQYIIAGQASVLLACVLMLTWHYYGLPVV